MKDNRKEAARLAAECIFWIIMGILFIRFIQWYGFVYAKWSGVVIVPARKKTAALILLIFAAILIHWHRSRKMGPGYIRKVFGVQRQPGRTYEYDWLRLLAVSLVIITHTIQIDLNTEGLIAGVRIRYLLTVLYVLCLACNLIYVMLSGGLLLPYREEKLSDFYLHRVSRVVLPMLVYFLFYLWANGNLQEIAPDTLGTALGNFFQGETPESPHYWLLYVTLSIYIVVPFFRYMLRDMPYKILTAMVIVSFVFMFFQTYCPIHCEVKPILASWIGVAVFGYWMTREETRRYDKYILILGLLSVGITMYYIKASGNFLEICCNCSPTMMMISGALFSLVYMFPKIFSKGNVVLSVLGKYSYSLILIHWTVLALLIKKEFQLFTNSYYYVGGILLSLVAALAVSFVLAFFIDNFVLVVVQQVFDVIVKSVRLLLKKKK